MAGVAALSRPFEQLREGDTFATRERTIAAQDIDSFAEQTGDRHPLHTDAEWAEKSAFGERIAPGALTLSYALGLVRLDPDHALALVEISDVLFLRPVGIGDTLSVEGRIAALDSDGPESGSVTISLLVHNQHRRPVCRARVRYKWKQSPTDLNGQDGADG